MANISSAYGTMTLKGAWTPALITILNKFASKIWAKWYYNIELDPFDPEETSGEYSATFIGNGRWAFNSNLECIGRWTADEVRDKPEFGPIYCELMSEMHTNGLTIEVSYSDEEGGCLVLYRQDGVLSSDGDMLVYQVTSEENLEYNWENYMDVTGDTDEFYLLVESLCEQLGIETEENGPVEHWTAARTYPHYSDYNDLGTDTKAEFNELFRSMPNNGELDLYLVFVKMVDELAGKRLIKVPVGAELVKLYASVEDLRKHGQEPSNQGYKEFIANHLISTCGISDPVPG